VSELESTLQLWETHIQVASRDIEFGLINN